MYQALPVREYQTGKRVNPHRNPCEPSGHHREQTCLGGYGMDHPGPFFAEYGNKPYQGYDVVKRSDFALHRHRNGTDTLPCADLVELLFGR